MTGSERKVAIVTGSVGGIGRAIAEALDRQGFSLVVHGLDQYHAGTHIATTLADAIYVDADVSRPEGADKISEAATSRWGRVDLLVNNAGIGLPVPHRDIAALTPEFWDRMLGVNLMGPWYLTQAMHSTLQEARGAIINIASIAGLTVSGSSIPYAVSKAALIHLTKLLAVAMGPDVRVNAIAPGYIQTDRTASWDEVRAAVTERSPLARVGVPEDVADACIAILTASYATGTILVLDGGLGLV